MCTFSGQPGPALPPDGMNSVHESLPRGSSMQAVELQEGPAALDIDDLLAAAARQAAVSPDANPVDANPVIDFADDPKGGRSYSPRK